MPEAPCQYNTAESVISLTEDRLWFMIYLYKYKLREGKNMGKKELAAQYHASGCNCAMAVGCAFCDKAGIDEDELAEKLFEEK